MTEKELIENIEQLLKEYKELSLLRSRLINDLSNTPKLIGYLTGAGVSTEHVLKLTYRKEQKLDDKIPEERAFQIKKKEAEKLMLDELARKVKDVTPLGVATHIKTIQAWRNIGSHNNGKIQDNVNNSTLDSVWSAYEDLVFWFIRDYLKNDIINEFIKAKNELVQENNDQSLEKWKEEYWFAMKEKSVSKKQQSKLKFLSKKGGITDEQIDEIKNTFKRNLEEFIEISKDILSHDELKADDLEHLNFARIECCISIKEAIMIITNLKINFHYEAENIDSSVKWILDCSANANSETNNIINYSYSQKEDITNPIDTEAEREVQSLLQEQGMSSTVVNEDTPKPKQIDRDSKKDIVESAKKDSDIDKPQFGDFYTIRLTGTEKRIENYFKIVRVEKYIGSKNDLYDVEESEREFFEGCIGSIYKNAEISNFAGGEEATFSLEIKLELDIDIISDRIEGYCTFRPSTTLEKNWLKECIENGELVQKKPEKIIKELLEKSAVAKKESTKDSSKKIKKGEQPRSAHKYEEVKIGDDIWMANTLKETYFRNGDKIEEIKTKTEWEKASDDKRPAYCYFKNKKNNCILYNWYAIADPRGLAPDGWKIPNYEKWSKLGSDIYQTQKGTEGIEVDSNIFSLLEPKSNGRRKFTGTFSEIEKTCLWTSSEGVKNGVFVQLYYSNYIKKLSVNKGQGFPVKCLKKSADDKLNKTVEKQKIKEISKAKVGQEAIVKKKISEKNLQQNEISISVGEDLDLDLINKLLIDLDFEKVDYVYEPGQFAVRGGILDIFSYHNECPYRIELFGDEIESIKEFDPVNQLSNISLNKIKIIPNIKNPKNIGSKKEDKTTAKTDSKFSINKKNQYKNFQFNTTKSDGFTSYKLFIFLIKAFIAFAIIFVLFYSFGQIFLNIF